MDKLVTINASSFKKMTGISGWSGINSPDELQTSSGLWVTKAGAQSFPGGFSYAPDWNNHWEWGAILEGSMEFKYNGKTIIAEKGSSYIMPSDITLTANPIEIPFVVWIEVAGPNVGDAFKKIGGNKGEIIELKYSPQQIKDVFKIARLLQEHPYGYGLNVHANLWKFIAGSINPGSGEERSYSAEIWNVLEYLNNIDNLNSISISSLTKIAGLSFESFRKRFKKETGESPKKYVLKLQIRKAKEHLSFKNMSIKEIAYQVGFQDQYYFSRLFKKYEGLSPEQFRRRFYPELYL